MVRFPFVGFHTFRWDLGEQRGSRTVAKCGTDAMWPTGKEREPNHHKRDVVLCGSFAAEGIFCVALATPPRLQTTPGSPAAPTFCYLVGFSTFRRAKAIIYAQYILSRCLCIAVCVWGGMRHSNVHHANPPIVFARFPKMVFIKTITRNQIGWPD